MKVIGIMNVRFTLLAAMVILGASGCSRRSADGRDDSASAVVGQQSTNQCESAVSPVRQDKTGGHEPKDVSSCERDIAVAAKAMLNANIDRGNFIKSLCQRISEQTDVTLRHRLFHDLVDQVFALKFEDVGDIHSKDEDERWEVSRQLGGVYASLETLVNEIQVQLMFKNAPPREQFEPMFRFYEKMCLESRRRGGCNLGYSGKLNDIEVMYGFSLSMKAIPDEDFAWVRAKFQELAGRPIRTLEQADADRRAEWERQRRERQAAQKKGAARPAK